jgi:rhodanese-related sulfurtransferase
VAACRDWDRHADRDRADELRKLTGESSQLVEVLPADDYGWAHLPGAVNLPLKELDVRTGELDRPRPVIVYCHDSL